ncbi:MAG: DUF1127 domain-containing protein [Pseudomonadota bacterium]
MASRTKSLREDLGAPLASVGRANQPSALKQLLDDPRVLVLWRFRSHSRAELRRMDDRALEDVGLSRETALEEARKPFWRA